MPWPEGEQPIRPTAVAIYVRWSTEEQGEGTTLAEQSERCRNYVLSQGWQVSDHLIFIDDGYSGASLERPGITRLRQLVRQGEVDCVVSLKIDRLSRSLVDCVDLVLREWAGCCFYKSVSQPVNTTDELGRVFFAILAGFAEYERALIRERTSAGLLQRVRQGGYWGAPKPPYGYSRVGKGRLAVHEPEAAVVRLLFQMAACDGLGPVAIAARLNELRIPGPAGRGWWPQTVRSILSSSLYTGRPVYGRRRLRPGMRTAGGGPVVQKRPAPLVTVPVRQAELAVVNEADFAAVQRLLQARAEPAATGSRTAHLLTGLARCRCGGPMVTGYDRHHRRFYRCQHRDRANGGTGCKADGGFIYADLVEPAVVAAMGQRHRSAVALSETACLHRHWQQDETAGAAPAWHRLLMNLTAQERRLEADRRRLLRQTRRGEMTIAEKRALEQDLAAEAQELAGRRAALTDRLAEAEAAGGRFGQFADWVAGIDAWAMLPLPVQKQILHLSLERVVLHKPKGQGQSIGVDLHWRV